MQHDISRLFLSLVNQLRGMNMQNFYTDVIKEDSGKLTYLTLPFQAKEVFHKNKGTMYVSGTINNIEYRSKLLSRGNGVFIMVLDKAMQKAIGFQGEKLSVHVTMELDGITDSSNVNEAAAIPDTSDMDILTAITTRRSIRKYTSQPVSDEQINIILRAGFCAPSAKNKRPFHFIIVKDKEILASLPGDNPNAFMVPNASCAIIICGDTNVQGMKEFIYEDCAAATQNMLLAIHGLGLGGVWCGVWEKGDFKKNLIKKLELPLKIQPVALIALGYPDEIRPVNPRWEDNKVHYDKW